jgi:phage terminase small subunit
VHPAVAVAEVAGSQVRTFAAKFGLTPSAEQRLSETASDGGDGENSFVE